MQMGRDVFHRDERCGSYNLGGKFACSRQVQETVKDGCGGVGDFLTWKGAQDG